MTIESPPATVNASSGPIFLMDLVRGMASQLVVVGHSINVFLPAIFMVPNADGGLTARPDGIYIQNFAVLIFFYISGYLITASFLKKSSVETWRLRHFLADRAARIYTPLVPLLLLLLVTDNLVFRGGATSPYTDVDAGLGDLLRNLTMLFDNPLLRRIAQFSGFDWLSGTAFGTADQLWTVVVEWWIYVVFGLLAFRWIDRSPGLGIWLVALGFAVLLPLATLLNSSGLIVAWAVGMAARLGQAWFRKMQPLHLALILGLSAIFAVLRWLKTDYDFYDPLTAFSLGASLFATMILLPQSAHPSPGVAAALVNNASKISYSLYLIHLSIIFYFAHWFPALIGEPASVLLMVCACNAGAAVLYVLFERHYPWVRRKMRLIVGPENDREAKPSILAASK